MDPLSMMASVVGLLTAAGTVSAMLRSATLILREKGLKVAESAFLEVNELSTVLSSFHQLLHEINSAPKHRISIIQLDPLIITLTEAVLTISELENLIIFLPTPGTGIRLVDRVKWARNEEAISCLIRRIQRHKTSLTLMLNIVQCESDLEAARHGESLHQLVEQLLRESQEMKQRLQNIEDFCSGAHSIQTKRFGLVDNEDEDAMTVTTVGRLYSRTTRPALKNDNNEGTSAAAFHSAFEEELYASRPYQRVRLETCDISFTTSVARTHAWSIFTGLSISDISDISVIALPVYLHEISNSHWYGLPRAGPGGAHLNSEAPTAPTLESPKELGVLQLYGRKSNDQHYESLQTTAPIDPFFPAFESLKEVPNVPRLGQLYPRQPPEVVLEIPLAVCRWCNQNFNLLDLSPELDETYCPMCAMTIQFRDRRLRERTYAHSVVERLGPSRRTVSRTK